MSERLIEVIWAKRCANFRLQVRPHSHKHYDLFFVLEGSAYYEIDGQEYIAKENCCVLVPPDTVHRQKPTDVATKLVEIKFIVNNTAAEDMLRDWPLLRDFCDDPYPREVMEYVVDRFFYRDERIIACMEYLLGSVFALGVKDGLRNETADSRYILTDGFRRSTRALVVYIETHYTSAFSLRSAATELVANPNYLCTAFKEDTGYGVLTYLNFVRLKQALFSITYNGYNVTEACEAAGYTNINTFSAAFRRYIGINPSTYRKYCDEALNAGKLNVSTEPVFSSIHSTIKDQMDSMASLGEKVDSLKK